MGKSIIAFCFMFIALLGGAVALPVLRQTMLDGGPTLSCRPVAVAVREGARAAALSMALRRIALQRVHP